MKLLLINPTITGEPESFHLGLAAIGTYIQAKSHHRVTILDFVFHRRAWRPHLKATLESFQPDLIGMYISTPFFPTAKMVATEIKRLRPDAKVLAGGHHATLSPDDVIAHKDIDMLIVGEGEIPTLKLLDVLEAGGRLDEVPGIWWKERGAIRKIEKGPLLPEGEIPKLDWDLYDQDTLRKTFYFFGMLPIMGSRGCPYKCSFCAITNVQRLYSEERFLRFRDPLSVVDEIEDGYRRYGHMGMRMVYFYDLNFLIRADWLKKFTDEYKRRGLNKLVPWSAYTRADHVDHISMECLRDSGCVNLRVGIEAANETMRNDVYVKQLTPEKLISATRAIKEAGIANVGYFLVGGPGERPEYLMESLEFSYDEGIEYPTFFLYKPLAGTDVLDRAAEMGSVIDTDSLEKSADFTRGVNMKHKHVTTRQILLFQLLTQVIFGTRIVMHQVRMERAAYLRHVASYVTAAIRNGFTPYDAMVYFVFYGYDHLISPPHYERAPARGKAASLLFKGLRLWLRSKDGGPPPAARAPTPKPAAGRPSRPKRRGEAGTDVVRTRSDTGLPLELSTDGVQQAATSARSA